MKLRFFSASLLALAASLPSAVLAQDSDVLVMRRAVAPAKNPANDLKPVEGADLNGYYWVVSGWIAGNDQCSAASEQTRYTGCVYQGKQADADNCPTPAPETTRTVEDWRGCEHQWTITGSGQWAEQCSQTSRPVSAECRRPDGTVVPDIYCSGDPKPTKEEGFNDAGCSYEWAIGEYGDWKSSCSENTSRERKVACTRSDGTEVADGLCGGDVPDRSEPGSNLSGCRFQWVPSAWASNEESCGGIVHETRTVSCERTDGQPAENDSFCTDDLPPLEREQVNYDACSNEWIPGEWTDWDSQCSTRASRERSVACIREDGQNVDPQNCDINSRPINKEEKEILSGCTHDWFVGEWSAAPSCSANAVRTRQVDCRRSDNTLANDSLCAGKARPVAEETLPDYSGCSYKWEVIGRSGWSSTCSAAATATQTIECQRSDKTKADASFCKDQPKPATSIVSANYTGCETEWAYGEWSDWSSTCDPNSQRERGVECYQLRPDPEGLTKVENSTCDLAQRETVKEEMAIYSECAASWEYGPWGWNGTNGAKSSTCSSSPKQNRTATCRKIGLSGEMETVADSECGATKDVIQSLNADYSGCSYDWINDSESDWTPWSGTCSPTATRTRPVQCQRDDGTIVEDNFCDDPKPESQQVGNVTDCTGLLNNPGFEQDLTGWYDSSGGRASITTDAKIDTKAVAFQSQSVDMKYAVFQGIGPVQSGQMFNFDLWCKGPGTLRVKIVAQSGTSRTETCGSGWTNKIFSIPVLSNSNSAYIYVAGSNVIVDNVVVTN